MLLSIILTFIASLSVTSHAQSAKPTYFAHDCSNDTTFVTNSTFHSNLQTLFFDLSSNSNNGIGFYNVSSGQEPDIVYGSFLCRGDLSPETCKDCVTVAIENVSSQCPVENDVIVWYDGCQLRYSNQPYFSSVTTDTWEWSWTWPNISLNQDGFVAVLGTAMRDTALKASNALSGAKMFSVGKVKFTSFQDLYTLAQCTGDLSNSDCARCLQVAISNLPICCYGMSGATVATPSCNIRYESSLFYNETLVYKSSQAEGKISISPVKVVAIVTTIAASIVIFCLAFGFLRRKETKKFDNIYEDDVIIEITKVESLQFDLNTIETATNKFSTENKLGEGGFGEVYKGTLPNGQETAIKKLSRSSRQGREEFKNELLLLAKLQHRNLVRLLGFCLEEEEKMLVYEFVPNKSLDYFLFDPEKQGQLDWTRRYNIIKGIAKGILYLHEDSRLKIIHRDLKVSNILLDKDMNPKISDFGMARIFGVDQTQANTNRIVGT